MKKKKKNGTRRWEREKSALVALVIGYTLQNDFSPFFFEQYFLTLFGENTQRIAIESSSGILDDKDLTDLSADFWYERACFIWFFAYCCYLHPLPTCVIFMPDFSCMLLYFARSFQTKSSACIFTRVKLFSFT